jgi:hypothetical protein
MEPRPLFIVKLIEFAHTIVVPSKLTVKDWMKVCY